MNATEASELLVLIATFDQRTVDDDDPERWAWMLATTSLDSAKEAVGKHYATQHRRVLPADILALATAEEGRKAICGFKNCVCTHEAPCDHGWVDSPDGESTRPCPTCRPQQARIVTESTGSDPGPERLSPLRDRGKYANR